VNRRLTALEHLEFVLSQLGEQECEVLLFHARRLLEGQLQYGPLDLENDRRNFQREKLEESIDRTHYEIFDLLREQKRRGANPRV
jgi:hypothetical protein